VKIHTNLADVDDTVFRWTVDALLEGRGYEPVFGMEALKAHDDGHDDGEDFHVRALRDVYERLQTQFGIYARAITGKVREWAGTRAMPFEQLRRALAVAAGHFMKAMGLAPGLPVPGDPAWKIDVVELPYKLSHLGLEDGDPSFSSIELKCFASTLDDEAEVRRAWERTVTRSPLASTLAKALDLQVKLAIV